MAGSFGASRRLYLGHLFIGLHRGHAALSHRRTDSDALPALGYYRSTGTFPDNYYFRIFHLVFSHTAAERHPVEFMVRHVG